jgi:hypothetical protein
MKKNTAKYLNFVPRIHVHANYSVHWVWGWMVDEWVVAVSWVGWFCGWMEGLRMDEWYGTGRGVDWRQLELGTEVQFCHLSFCRCRSTKYLFSLILHSLEIEMICSESILG